MAKGKLYIMVGIPASGKSTFAKKYDIFNNIVIISRDKIRFSLLKEEDSYFSKEEEVYDIFCKEINDNLALGFDVFADATHLTKKSRAKLIKNINKNFLLDISAIYMDIPLKECIKRNKNRQGREYVPEKEVEKMYNNLQKPDLEEGFKTIYIVNEDEKIVAKRRMEDLYD